MKPKNADELSKLLVSYGWEYAFASYQFEGMLRVWPEDMTLLFCEDVKSYDKARLFLLKDDDVSKCPQNYAPHAYGWPVFAKVDKKTSDAKASEKLDDKEKEMMFFFKCKPTDPSTLPPPPKVLGRSWDDIADE